MGKFAELQAGLQRLIGAVGGIKRVVVFGVVVVVEAAVLVVVEAAVLVVVTSYIKNIFIIYFEHKLLLKYQTDPRTLLYLANRRIFDTS